jgi:hypothetical protein
MNNIAIASTKIKLPSIGRPLGYRPLIDSIELFIRHRDRATYGTDTTLPDVMAAARKHGVNFMPPTPCRNHQGVFHGNKIRLYQPNVPFLKSLGKLNFPTPRSRVLTRVDVAVDLHYATNAQSLDALPAWQRGIVQKWNRNPTNNFEASTYTAKRDSQRNVDIYPSIKGVVRIELRAQTPMSVKALNLSHPEHLGRLDIVSLFDQCMRWQPFTMDDFTRIESRYTAGHAVRSHHLSTFGLLRGRQGVSFSELLGSLGLTEMTDDLC